MPVYSYKCNQCHTIEDHVVAYDLREKPRSCSCGQGYTMEYQFPYQAIHGFQPFEPYFDESLDMNIYGKREKQRILKALGLVEAGDAQGGARNFDKHAPDHVKPEPVRPEADAERAMGQMAEPDDEYVASLDKDGNVLNVNKLSELPTI